MTKKFITKPQLNKKNIQASTEIKAADENEDTRVADGLSTMKDDFNYAMDSIDLLDRDGKTAEVLEVMNQLQSNIEAAIYQLSVLITKQEGGEPAEASTDIQAATLDDMVDAVQNRIDELEGQNAYL